MGAESGGAPFEITLEPGLQRFHGRRLSFVAHARSRQSELLGTSPETCGQEGDHFGSGFYELPAEGRDLLRPWCDCIARRIAAGGASECGVALRDGSGVVDSQRRTHRCQPPDHTIEVGPPHGGPALHHGKPVGREDERRDFRAQLLCRTQRSTVQLCLLPFAQFERHLELDSALTAAAPQSDPARLLAEANQLGVCTRPRRKPLGTNV